MDDILVKSIKGNLHVSDLREAFDCIHLHNVHLNSSKYAIGVKYGYFLGFMVNECKINVKSIEEINS